MRYAHSLAGVAVNTKAMVQTLLRLNIPVGMDDKVSGDNTCTAREFSSLIFFLQSFYSM
jgi:hypothetical protein